MGAGRSLWLVFALLFGGLLAPFSVSAIEELGPDGFPKDWKPSDFAIGRVSATVAVSGVGGIVKPWTKAKTSTVDQLPHVKANIPGQKLAEAAPPAVVVSATAAEDLPPVPDDLAALSSYGPLRGAKGVGEDIWRASSFPDMQALLGKFGKSSGDSLFMRRVVRRLLLTEAAPPAGTDGPRWLLARAGALQSMGYYEAAYGLLGRIPDRVKARDAALARAWTESLLLVGHVKPACSFAGGQVVNAPADPFWPMAVLVCQVVEGMADGKMDKLGLGLQLVTPDQKKAYGPLLSLLEAVRDGKVASPEVARGGITPLMGAVYAAYPALIDATVMDKLPDVVWRRLVQSTALPLGLRVPAAEKLADRSEVPADGVALGLLYNAFTFTPEQMVDPVGASGALVESGRGYEARALLWRVAADAKGMESLRSASWQLWRSYMMASGMGGVVRLMGVAGLEPTDSLAWMVPLVMRDALLAGDASVAGRWWPSLRDNKTVSADLAKEKPLLAMLAGGFKADAGLWKDWEKVNLLESSSPQGLMGRSDLSRVLSVLDEEGVVLPDGIWGRLAAVQEKLPARVPDDVAARKVMQAMVDKGEEGRVLLNMALLVGKNGMDGISAEQAVWVLKTLRSYGFDKEARALAAEAVLPAMVPVARPFPKVMVNGLKKVGVSGKEIGGGKVVVPTGGDGLILPPPRVEKRGKK